MTEYAYSRKLVCISEETSMSRMRSVKSSSGGAGGVRAMRLKLLNRWAMSIQPVVPVGEMTGAPDQDDHPEPAVSTKTWRVLSTRLPLSPAWSGREPL